MVSRERGRSRVSRLDDITLIRSGDFIYAASSRRFQARTVREEADGKPPITQILHLCQGARFLITLQFDPLERDAAALEEVANGISGRRVSRTEQLDRDRARFDNRCHWTVR